MSICNDVIYKLWPTSKWSMEHRLHKQCSGTCLGPIITRRVCKNVAVGIEAAACDGLVKLFRRLQFGSCIFVPETKTAVWPNSRKGAMGRMKCYVIHLITSTKNSQNPVILLQTRMALYTVHCIPPSMLLILQNCYCYRNGR